MNEAEVDDFQDIYIFLRTTEGLSGNQLQRLDDLEALATVDGQVNVFTLLTGPDARLYVVKEESIGSRTELADLLAGLDVDKALSSRSCTPDRIVHLATLHHMAFVKVWVTPGTVPCPVLQDIATLPGFVGGSVVYGHHDIFVEFGDDADVTRVQSSARAVATKPGVARTSIRYVESN
jgi:hypothetical protein